MLFQWRVHRLDGPKLPVVVFIHGESYEWNSGNPYDGSVLASYGNVIVVTINYRLGVLGFLPTLDGSPRGNYGLMDQIAALHWVQENIPEFGGDPTRVTLFGHGHGAACVHLLMLSPLAKGIFRRAILQSGTALSPWAIARDAVTYTKQTARHLKCPTEDNTVMVECLRQKHYSSLLTSPLQIPDHLASFGPTIDGNVIPEDPSDLLDDTKASDVFRNCDLLLGATKVESPYVTTFSSQEDRNGIEVSRRDRLLRTLVRNLFDFHLREIFLTVANEYTDWSKPDRHPVNVLDATADAMGDAVVVAPLVRTANYHSTAPNDSGEVKQDGKTFFYTFVYQREEGLYSQRTGCVHGEDLPLVFGAPLVHGQLGHFPANFTRAEATLSEATITYWTNFIKTGDPNLGDGDEDSVDGTSTMETTKASGGKPLEKVISWPAYDNLHQKYLAMGQKPRVRDHYHAHRLSFWLNLIPTLHRYTATSTELNERHHLLEEHDDPTTYDGIYRVSSNLNDPHRNSYYYSIKRRKPSTSTTTTTNPLSAVSTGVGHVNSTSKANHATVLPDQQTNATKSLVQDGLGDQQGAFSTALGVTVAIGCSLLVLNALVFAGVYYQRERHHRQHNAILQKKKNKEYQMRHDQLSCNSKQQVHHLVTTPLDEHMPPAFLSSIEAGSLPSKLPPPGSASSSQDSAHQPLLLTATPTQLLPHHRTLSHWPGAPPSGQHQSAALNQSDLRVLCTFSHPREKREETTV